MALSDPVSARSTRPSRLRAVLQSVALLVGGSVVGLVLTELAARALYERPWYDHLSDDQLQAETLDYRLNSFGLRGDDFAIPKPEGVRRVYMAGDSFTFGMGVADRERVMPALVEARLNGELPIEGIEGVEVLNAGMLRGSLPRHWRTKWLSVSEPFDPDVVLLVFFLRDGTNTGSIPAFFGAIREEITDRNAADPLYRSSYVLRTLRDFQDREQVASRYTEAFRAAYFGSEDEQKEWRSAQYNVIEMKKDAEAKGAVVGFVIYPILVDLDFDPDRPDAYPFQDICELLEGFAAEHGMPTLNLLDAFRGEHGPDLWVSPFDQHPNERGHVIAAEAITPFVSDLLRASEAEGIASQGVSQP